MKNKRILIVGATGRVGGEVLRRLSEQRTNLRVLVRRPAVIKSLPGGIEAAVGDLGNQAQVAAAVDGVTDVLVAIRDCPEQPELEGNLIDAARAAGVQRFVKVSAFAAGLSPPPGYGRIHAEIENKLQKSGMRCTILRPYMYMQNFFDVASAIRAAGLIPFPLGRCRIAFIDAHDVARVASAVLSNDKHAQGTYVLTGPDAMSVRDCADVLGNSLDRKLRYLPVPQWLAGLMMRRDGISRWDIDMRAELFRMLRAGGEAETTDSVEQLTGKAGTTFAEFAAKNRGAFN